MTIYFISGLGADKRAFKRIELPANITVKHLEWQPPFPDESLTEYAKRFSLQVDQTEKFAIAGLSFGGIMAIELLKYLEPETTFIISGMACRAEIPLIFRYAGMMRLNRLMPMKLLRQPTKFSYWLFGCNTPDEKQLLREIILGTSPDFLSWAIEKILHWKQLHRPGNILHIHGSKDRLLPVRLMKPDIIIEGGGHLMIYTHANIISQIISDKLAGE